MSLMNVIKRETSVYWPFMISTACVSYLYLFKINGQDVEGRKQSKYATLIDEKKQRAAEKAAFRLSGTQQVHHEAEGHSNSGH